MTEQVNNVASVFAMWDSIVNSNVHCKIKVPKKLVFLSKILDPTRYITKQVIKENIEETILYFHISLS